MKSIKFIAPAVLLALSITAVKAQTADIEIGVKAGANISTLKTGLSAVTDKSGKVGFNAGVFARLGKTWFFQPEVNFVTFSDKYQFNATTYNAKFKQLNAPLMIGYKVLHTVDMNVRVSAGPDFSYNLNKPVAPAGNSYKKLSVGNVLNAGIDVGNLTVDARYSLGLSNLNKTLGQKANIFSLAVGFKFQ